MEDVNHSLICAVSEGNLEIARQLINTFGLSYSKAWAGGYSLLLEAVKLRHAAIAKLLLTNGSEVNSRSEEPSETPLHFAVEYDRKIVKMILDKGANIDAKNQHGQTPLYNSIKHRKIAVTKLLLKRGACVNSRDDCNAIPLHIAIQRKDTTVVRLLLHYGAKVDNQDQDGKTALHIAVEKGNLTIVEDVLKYCPDVNNESNRRSLITAMQNIAKTKMVNILLQYGFVIYPEYANNPMLLDIAVRNEYLNIVADLLKYGADVNVKHKGYSPLHIAVRYKQEKITKLLISYEADVNARDKTRRTAIFHSIENTDLKITKLLLASGANIKDKPELLNIAAQKNCIEIVKVLLQHGADINASDERGETALHCTASKEFEYITQAELNMKVEIAKLLLTKGANVNSQTKKGVTPLHAAAKLGYAKVFQILLEYNTNLNSGDTSDITQLHVSGQTGNEDICMVFLNKAANINAKRNDNGMTALHIATQHCGIKVKREPTYGIPTRHLYAERNYEEIVETILKFGADVDSRDKYGRTALHIASHMGQVEIVTTLLEYGSDINITDTYNKTLLDSTLHARMPCTICELHNYSSDDTYYDGAYSYTSQYTQTTEILNRHIVKMKAANFYVSEQNLQLMHDRYKMSNSFKYECEGEISSMKNEKINNTNISYYVIMEKNTSSLAYIRNTNIVQVLKSGDYKTKFPIYASMIQHHFRKALERNKLLEQSNEKFHFLCNNFPELPYDCTAKIFSYLSNNDLKMFIGCM